MPRRIHPASASTRLGVLTRWLSSSGLVVLATIVGCALPFDDGQHEACELGPQTLEPQDAEAVGIVQEELSSHSCKMSEATGYKSGKAFKIKVVTIDGKHVEWQTANAYLRMATAAAKDGVQIRIVSGFRTQSEQQALYNCYKTCSCNNCNHASVPGYSNHQSGHALDLNASSPGVFSWLSKHAGEHGFKGFSDENWHWEWWGTDPGTGPCNGGTLKAKLTKRWSNAKRFRGKGAHYAVCAGAPVKYSFTLANKGSATWRDVDGRGSTVGSDVFLVTANGKKDRLTGKKRFSVRLNGNSSVRGDRKAKDCSNKNGCRRTTFIKGAIVGTAPNAPGVYATRWRLRDYSKAWGKKSKGFGPKIQLKLKVVSCEQPKQECGCRVWCSDGKSHKLAASITSASMCKVVAQTYCKPAESLDHTFQSCTPTASEGSGGMGGSAGSTPPASNDPSPGNDDVGNENDDNGLTPVDDADDGIGTEEPDDPDFEDDGYPGFDETTPVPAVAQCSVSTPSSSSPAGLALLILLGGALVIRARRSGRAPYG